MAQKAADVTQKFSVVIEKNPMNSVTNNKGMGRFVAGPAPTTVRRSSRSTKGLQMQASKERK